MTNSAPNRAGLVLVLFGLSACVGEPTIGGNELRPDASTPQNPPPVSSLNGARLYADKGCVGCHGPLATSQKRNASFERIRAAAGPQSRIGPMQGIMLTDEEVRALVMALSDGSSASGSDRRRPLVKPLLLTRSELMSRLLSIFRPVEGAEYELDSLVQVLETALGQQPAFLGGHCNAYDDCGVTAIDASQTPATSVVRAGLLIQTCLQALQIEGAQAAVLAKVELRPDAPVTTDNVTTLWDLFAPGRPLDPATADLVTQAAAAATPPSWDVPIQLFCRPTVLEAI